MCVEMSNNTLDFEHNLLYLGKRYSMLLLITDTHFIEYSYGSQSAIRGFGQAKM